MIDEFDYERLQHRLAFLTKRAKAHLNNENDRRWHHSAAATLLRDAAAIAFMRDEIDHARDLLRRSGNLFFELGLAAGLQLLYIAGDFDNDDSEYVRINTFRQAFSNRLAGERPPTSAETGFRFDDQSFQPPQLLRVYQALAGRRTDDDESYSLRRDIRKRLTINATMPVGATRIALATYLGAYDQLANRGHEVDGVPLTNVGQVLNSLAQRREELLNAARRDNFHWKALLRPAELIDFDLLALLLAGISRGQQSALISTAFTTRDALTALPQALAQELGA